MIIERRLADTTATEALGAGLVPLLRRGDGGVIYLQGTLGAGKTTLARGLLRALEVSGSIRSPTYTLMELYEINGLEIIHLDLYRLSDASELLGLGLDDYPPERCWWLVEWPEHGAGYLPAATLTVSLQVTDNSRLARIEGDAASITARGLDSVYPTHSILP